MITLAEAFELCGIDKGSVYIRHIDNQNDKWNSGYIFWKSTIGQKIDMQKTYVTKIESHREFIACDFTGWSFVITGISADELKKARYSGEQNNVNFSINGLNYIPYACQKLCKCYVPLDNGGIRCLNPIGCPYDILQNDYGLD